MQTLQSTVIAWTLMLLTGCADPAVWSAVAPGYSTGVSVSRVAVAVEDMQDPGRSWSERKLADELSAIGVYTVGAESKAEALLTMRLVRQRYVIVDVPLVYHPGETKVITYEKKGKTVTKIKERPGYTTGGYSYEVPEATAAFTLDVSELEGRTATVWTANTTVRGEENAGWAALAVDIAQRTVRQLRRDKVLLPAAKLQMTSK
ncbi:MAG: hypothetical protein GKS03_00925 [Alphaproteobacteria bacterium]|nr:hypothetical protein [Alphaproteobacteria bacterium]